MSQIAQTRIKREAQILATAPTPGVTAWSDDANMYAFTVEIEGPEGSPYEGGLFRLAALLGDRYPFEPPKVVFKTRIYHPNIDSSGRICSDVLKLPPKGCWSPKMNLNAVFGAMRMLMAEPNPDDPLEHEIAEEFKSNRATYFQKAQAMTKQYAIKLLSATMETSISVAVPTVPAEPTDSATIAASEPSDNVKTTKVPPAAEGSAPPSNATSTTPLEAAKVLEPADTSVPQPLKIGGGKKRAGLGLAVGKGKKLK